MTEPNLPRAILSIQDVYTRSLIISALTKYLPSIDILSINSPSTDTPNIITSSRPSLTLYWQEYEDLDFSHLLVNPQTTLANSYCIRKGLIRKAQLSQLLHKHVIKNPESILTRAVPETWLFEVPHVEYLDEALEDVFEVLRDCEANQISDSAENNERRKKNFILKPNLVNKGAEVVIFESVNQLRAIFERDSSSSGPLEQTNNEVAADSMENFSDQVSNDEISDEDESMFHIREWVIQRYISNPRLINDRKFHIRAYVLAISNIKVYLHKDMLALFALKPYDPENIHNTLSHLTNTCLQINQAEYVESEQVKLFWELKEKANGSSIIPVQDLNSIFDQIKDILRECFKAVVGEVTQFMPWENAFELFGFDFIVDENNQVYILEANSFPDFKQTGSRLSYVITKLFEGTVALAVVPFFNRSLAIATEERNQDVNSENRFVLVFERNIRIPNNDSVK